MKKLVIIIILFVPFLLNAQNIKGVNFVQPSNWAQILEQAKKEHKYIFIDAMATWCKPCKDMERIVYSDSLIGSFMTDKFLSIKLQFDKTAADSQWVKNWHVFANELQRKYRIDGFPTLLFINSEGDLVYLEMGYKGQQNFIEIARAALSSDYALMIKQFNTGALEDYKLPKLAMQATKFHNDSLAKITAVKYKSNYIDVQNPSKILSPELSDFISAFYDIFTINDKIFKFIYSEPRKTDSLVKFSGFAQQFTDLKISNAYVSPKLNKKSDRPLMDPHWYSMEKQIQKKFDKNTALRIIRNEKVKFYYQKKDWQNYIIFNMEKFEKEGLDEKGFGYSMFNNFAYEFVFKYSSDKLILQRAIALMENIIKTESPRYTHLDTYACLLYKAGNIEKALSIEERALNAAKKKKDQTSVREYENNLEMMKRKLPFWEKH